MTHRRVHLAVVVVAVVAGCSVFAKGGSRDLSTLTGEYNSLQARRGQAPAGPQRTAVETQLAELGRQAAAGGDAAQDPMSAVAYYRLAVLAAWQAGTAGEHDLLTFSDAGGNRCSQLPNHDASRPGDCSMIRLAAVLAVVDSVQRELRPIQAKLDGLQQDHQQRCATMAPAERDACTQAPVKLPAADGATLQHIFGQFETQFDKATTLRASLDGLAGVDQSLKDAADTDRAIIYCSAVTAWSRMLDVDGVSTSTTEFVDMTTRRNAMRTRLQQGGNAVDCRTVAAKPLAL